MLSDIGGYAAAEGFAGDALGGLAQVAAHQLHAVAAVGGEQAVAQAALRRAAVNHGNEVGGDDNAVLTPFPGVLSYELLFDYLHSQRVVEDAKIA